MTHERRGAELRTLADELSRLALEAALLAAEVEQELDALEEQEWRPVRPRKHGRRQIALAA
jgi:hypothetical protein